MYLSIFHNSSSYVETASSHAREIARMSLDSSQQPVQQVYSHSIALRAVAVENVQEPKVADRCITMQNTNNLFFLQRYVTRFRKI